MKFSITRIALYFAIFLAHISALSLESQATIQELSSMLQTAEEADRANVIINESELSGAEMNKQIRGTLQEAIRTENGTEHKSGAEND